MKKLIAIFSVLAMFSVAAIAQDAPKTKAPKNTVATKPMKKPVVPRKVVKTKAVKANVPAAKMNK